MTRKQIVLVSVLGALALVLSFSISSFGITINIEKTPKATGPAAPAKKHGPVILDARPAFEFAMGHFQDSYNIRWQDFSQTGPGHEGELDPDYSMLARKLRVHGVNIHRPVVVLGDGAGGHGEEGRVAWMLNFLGVKKVEVKNFKNLKGRLTINTDDDELSVAPWEPAKQKQNTRIGKSELSALLAAKGTDFVIIDVRTPSEFSEKPLSGAVNIPWTSFVDGAGEMMAPDGVREVLRHQNVDVSKLLIFYSSLGVRSGYVTFAAVRAGLNAINFDGGLTDWNLH